MQNALKRLAFTGIVIVVPTILFLLGAEIMLRLTGIGYSSQPLLKTEVGNKEVWVGNPDFTRLFFPNALKRLPPPVRIPVQKSPKEKRYLVVGGSAAAGDPDVAFSISRNLEWILSQVDPETDFNVINLAYTACNSHVAREVVLQSEPYALDGIIVLVGNNEVIGPYGPGTTLTESLLSLRKRNWQLRLRKTRLGQLGQMIHESSSRKSGETAWRGMQHFLQHEIAGDDPRLRSVYSNFQKNLEDIESEARRQGIPVLLSNVPVNLIDQPPFLGDLEDLPKTWRQAILQYLESGRSSRSLEEWTFAAEKYPDSAYIPYIAGNLLFESGQATRADTLLRAARDRDRLRFRADSKLNEIIREQWSRPGTNWVPLDAELPLIDDNPRKVLGFPHFYEHVHFSFRANFLIAKTMAEALLQHENLSTGSLNAINWQRAAAGLAYTSFETWSILKEIQKRFAKPPFRDIPGYGRKTAWIDQLVNQLTDHISKAEQKTRMNEAYVNAIKARPQDDFLQRKLAGFLASFGRREAAFPIAEELLNRNPTDVDLALFTFGLAIDTGNRQAAEAALDRTKGFFPNHPEIETFEDRLKTIAD